LNNYNQINHHIFIGDFNSNKVWDYKRSEGDHSTCVRLLKNKNILSLYHEYMNESQGEELMPTFYLHRNITKQYHIDYAFIPNSLLADASLSVGNHDEWLEISDHMPLVIEISQYPPLLTR
jgi:endonuclease/exonuclease/phosphatase family metal-dependent hydrolase